MRWLLDLAYLVGALVTSPIWLTRMLRTGRIRTDWRGRFGAAPGRVPGEQPDARPCVLIHAVSVGEVNAIRDLVANLAAASVGAPAGARVVVATTTDTGFARATDLFGAEHLVVRYPFDFSFAVGRFLCRVAPDVVALVELEVWPNFTATCARRGTPVCLINGRLSARSVRRYRRVLAFVRPSFGRVAAAGVQNETYAARFREMGVAADRIAVTGTMKWDTARIADDVPPAAALAQDMGIDRDRLLVVAGSTAPEEHRLLHEAVPEGVQLLCAPRRPEWFDDAERDLPECARRSRGDSGSASGRFLLDTIGELRAAYALADVVVVGRTFGRRHGSDMMEPVALGRATIIGPAVGDFETEARALLEGGGLVQTDADGLATTLRELIDDPARRARHAECGRAVIRVHQGATRRHGDLIRSLVDGRSPQNETRRLSR